MQPKAQKSEAVVERRKGPRKALNIIVQYQPLEAADAYGSRDFTENISAGGMALRCENKINVGQELLLTLCLPRPEKRAVLKNILICDESESEKVRLKGQVVWNAPIFGGRNIHGVKFKAIALDDVRIFTDFLKEFSLLAYGTNGEELDRF
ncbi:PilZ domain-containing protein [candidate division FCPU426 bacterium]|nr:PilZ domain-containing protein [candidate division FCPU426 bacterium]